MKAHPLPRRAGATVALVAIVLSAVAATAVADETLKTKALAGTWVGARYDEGKGEDPEKGVKLQLVFEGDKVVATRIPTADVGEGSFKLSDDGKQIDAIGKTGGFRSKTYLGIIKVEGDTLYWCTTSGSKDQKRPNAFSADPGEHTYLIVVKRQKT